MRFINDICYLPEDNLMEIPRRTQPREKNIFFVQISFSNSMPELKDYRINTIMAPQNKKIEEQLCINYDSEYRFPEFKIK